MRNARPLALAAVLLSSAASSALASDLAVPMDEVRMVAFGKPVTTVYVGNPAIADVTVIDSRHVFLLGRSFGSTNLIALGQDGKLVANTHVTVFTRGGATVTVQRGPNSVTYACANAQCRPAPLPGDAQTTFDTVTGQRDKHQDESMKAASAQQ
jgi:Flp pilus assembly secretin CpaC